MVIPKPLREAIGFGDGGEIEIEFADGALVLTPPAVTTRIEHRDHRPVIVTDDDLPPLRDELVRAALDDIRR